MIFWLWGVGDSSKLGSNFWEGIISDTKITIGNLISDGFGLGFGRMGEVIKVAWFPFLFGMIAMGVFVYFTMQPLILAYVDFIGTIGAAAQGAAIGDPNAAFLAGFEEIGYLQVSMSYLVMMFGAFLIYAIPTVAYSQMVATGYAPRGPFYFKLGPKEINVMLDYVLITLISAVVMVLVALAVGAVIGGVVAAAGSGDGTEPAAVGGMIVMVIALTFGMLFMFAWIFSKFGLAFPIASIEGGLGLRRAWSMSRGHSFKLAMAIIAAYIVMFVLYFVAILVVGIVLVPLTMVGGSMENPLIMMIVGGVVYVAFYIVTYSIMLAIPVGIFSGLYRRLKPDASGVSETFS